MGLLDVIHRARTLESRIARALSQAAGNINEDDGGVREPLEVAHAIMDAVERQIQPGSRGTRIFPFNRIAVSVAASSRDLRVRFESLFAATPSLRDRIVERLQSARCDVDDVQVAVTYVGRPSRSWKTRQFDIAFDRVDPASRPAPIEPKPGRVEVTIVRGTAEQRTYSFSIPRIDFGRGAEVRDHRHRLLRANDVVFVEGSEGVNQTVSRRHAHMLVDALSGECRLHDDRSVHGTGVVREGHTIAVPPGSRGVRVQSGDEIVLGEARVKIRLLTAPSTD